MESCLRLGTRIARQIVVMEIHSHPPSSMLLDQSLSIGVVSIFLTRAETRYSLNAHEGVRLRLNPHSAPRSANRPKQHSVKTKCFG